VGREACAWASDLGLTLLPAVSTHLSDPAAQASLIKQRIAAGVHDPVAHQEAWL